MARGAQFAEYAPMNAMPKTLDDTRFAAVLARDAAPACDAFLYAVTSQGIYCRPGCPSPAPLRRHVRFFADWGSAEAAGFRPCKRCDPRGDRARLQAEAVRAACAMIEAAEGIPSLASLAALAGYAPHHFQRMFRDITGVTPRSYAEGVRGKRLSAALAEGARVAEAVAGAGFGSESRVYENTARHLGMRPGRARRGGAGEVIRIAWAESAFGPLLLGATDQGVCFLGFGEARDALEGDLRARFPQARIEAAPADISELAKRAIAFIAEPRAALELPLDLRGTIFQRRVWEALRGIPLGQTTTYSALAAAMGEPKATRAVARACAQNPVSLSVPCHRVVGKDGDVTGYRWGVARKRALLAGERGA